MKYKIGDIIETGKKNISIWIVFGFNTKRHMYLIMGINSNARYYHQPQHMHVHMHWRKVC